MNSILSKPAPSTLLEPLYLNGTLTLGPLKVGIETWSTNGIPACLRLKL
jgi:hypothetical protein